MEDLFGGRGGMNDLEKDVLIEHYYRKIGEIASSLSIELKNPYGTKIFNKVSEDYRKIGRYLERIKELEKE